MFRQSTCALVASLALVLWAGQSRAGTLDCDPEFCGWSITVDGVEEASGGFTINEDGRVEIEGDTTVSGDGFTAGITGFSGDVDPEIIFGIGATNTSSAAKTYAFAFSLPLGGFNFGNSILTEAALGTTLTASSFADATLFPTLGIGKIVDSQDIQLSPFESIDKGVDIGDALVDPAGGDSTLRNEIENGIIGPGFSFDLLSVTVAFGLVDTDQADGNPGNVGVGLSGRVTQVVPEPGTALLLGAGLLGLVRAGTRRRV